MNDTPAPVPPAPPPTPQRRPGEAPGDLPDDDSSVAGEEDPGAALDSGPRVPASKTGVPQPPRR
jgi:hypothetical protein